MNSIRPFFSYFFFASALFFSLCSTPSRVFAAGSSFDMKAFQSQMHTDFILPSVLATHPGPMFYFSHSKELALTPQQLNKIKKITHKIIPKTAKQLKKIEELKAVYFKLMQSPAPDFHKSKKLLNLIGRNEAIATADHLEAHLACYHILTKQQKSVVASILAKKQ
jgi:Spy/CpxP family protein refolding chaperone